MASPHPTLETRASDVASSADGVGVAAGREPVGSRYVPGDVIAAKYRLEHPLGQGGMGSVWLARNLVLDVDVAIKVTLGTATTEVGRARLLREAQTAARLQHPSIVRVYDFGQTAFGDPFIVMEVVKGESLADLLDRRGRLSAVHAVQLLLPIAGALSVAHGKGIVHRDVKPSNIILMAGERGEISPKLVDFGIAKVGANDRERLTRVGSMIGSPDYMSPEQIRARADLDERADVWSLAVVLYETIVGRRPFEESSPEALLGAILVDAPTPTHQLGAGDAALWAVIEQGLQKNRDLRWSTVRAMGRALARWALGAGVTLDSTGTSLERQWLNEGEAAPGGPIRAAHPEPVAVAAAHPVTGFEPKRTSPRAAAVVAGVLAGTVALAWIIRAPAQTIVPERPIAIEPMQATRVPIPLYLPEATPEPAAESPEAASTVKRSSPKQKLPAARGAKPAPQTKPRGSVAAEPDF